MFLDARSKTFVAAVLEVIDRHVPVLEAFLLGSGAVGGFDPSTSDIDLVVVVEHPLGIAREPLVQELAALEAPVRDLELVVYVEGRQPPSFELNLNGGVERPGEEPFWFVLDAAVAQERAVPVRGQHHWDEFFVPIAPRSIRKAMQESLEWAQRRPADDEFARLQAARARHYLARGEWIGKAAATGRDID